MKKSVYLLVTLIFTIPCYPATVYVNWDGSADYTTIQAAINAADPNDTVIVAPGTYVENVNMLLKNGIALQGSGSDVTTIDGGSNGHVVTFNASSGSISGFTITNSGSDPGYSAGVFTSNCTVDVVDNIITGNNYGITFSSGADGLIFGNRVTNNTNHAINIKSSFAVITNNLIANNSRHGVYCYKSSPFMSNNTIINNNYGILCSPTSEQIIMNNIIVSNNYGIMALGDDSSPVPLLNISYNDVNANSTADYWYEWVIYCIPEDPFCIPQGESESFTPLPGTGEIHVNPIFVDQSNGDYHLKSQAGRWDPVSEDWVLDVSTSPCIDAGNPGCPIGDEPADAANMRINMGAYGGTAQASRTPAGWGLLTDIDNSWSLNMYDVTLFSHYWLDTGECLPADYGRDQSVTWLDFAKIYNEWLHDRQIIEPDIIDYQIDECDMFAAPGDLITADSLSTRFTVVVDGSNILFSDIMVANCCPDELLINMIVDGDLITVYEIEHLSMPCYCICDYPVTATFGPFAPGTYTLEVYEDWGGFIGSTTFIIE